LSKALELETIFIVTMFKVCFTYCKVSRIKDSPSNVLQILEKTDFRISK